MTWDQDNVTQRRAARKAGTRTYIGTPCWLCGGAEHYTSSGACISCAKWRNSQRYIAKHAEIAIKDAARYQKKKLTGA